MEMQSQNNNRMSEVQYESSAFYQLFQAQQNLLEEIVKTINKTFSPLSWILQQTLYKRVKKEQKGWININFLHKNPLIKNLFKKNEVSKHSRRKRNILKKAIQKSILKRKRNLIKRKEYLKINENIKNVIYLELKSSQPTLYQTNQQNQMPIQNILRQTEQYNLRLAEIMKESNLREIIKSSINIIKLEGNFKSMENQNQPMEIEQHHSNRKQNNQQNNVDKGRLLQSIQIKGQQVNQQQLTVNKKHQNTQNNIKTPLKSLSASSKRTLMYKWCFVYIPQLNQDQMEQILLNIRQNINITTNKLLFLNQDKMQLQTQMDHLNLLESQIPQTKKQSQIKNTLPSISIYSLKDMINQYYPKYQNICKQIGYHQLDNRQIKLRQKKKQKEKQKKILFQCKKLDKKVDLTNQYHRKLQIQRQKQNYFLQKQIKRDQKRRLKLQKRRNKINSFSQQKNNIFQIEVKSQNQLQIHSQNQQGNQVQMNEQKAQTILFNNQDQIRMNNSSLHFEQYMNQNLLDGKIRRLSKNNEKISINQQKIEQSQYFIKQSKQKQCQKNLKPTNKNKAIPNTNGKNSRVLEQKSSRQDSPAKFVIKIPKIRQEEFQNRNSQKGYRKSLINNGKKQQKISNQMKEQEHQIQFSMSQMSQQSSQQQFQLRKKRDRTRRNANSNSKNHQIKKNHKKTITNDKIMNQLSDKKRIISSNSGINNEQSKSKASQVNLNKNNQFKNRSNRQKQELATMAHGSRQQKKQHQKIMAQSSNNAYNLRTKKHTEGSYRKMVQYSALESISKQHQTSEKPQQQQEYIEKQPHQHQTRSSRVKTPKYY